MADGHDRAMVRQAIVEGWPISIDERRQLMAALQEALKDARGKSKGKARAIASVAKVLLAADRLNQTDYQFEAERHQDEPEGVEIRYVKKIPNGSSGTPGTAPGPAAGAE